MLITSPTYDGIVSDIKRIAEIAHEHKIPLIVDEAHGAHFCFSEYFPVSAAELGADIVIHSLHKTLPSMTQTSLLHLCSDRVSRELLTRFLGIYQTSSPSYVLMASMDACLYKLREKMERNCFQNIPAIWNRQGNVWQSAGISGWKIQRLIRHWEFLM